MGTTFPKNQFTPRHYIIASLLRELSRTLIEAAATLQQVADEISDHRTH